MTDLKIVDDSECEAPEPFLLAFAEWMKARAVCWANEAAPGVHEDHQMATAVDALTAAEWKLLQTPAEALLHIRMRAEVVQEMMVTADHAGRPTDNRHNLMLYALVSEIQRYTGPN